MCIPGRIDPVLECSCTSMYTPLLLATTLILEAMLELAENLLQIYFPKLTVF
jgi:hypothetical protein